MRRPAQWAMAGQGGHHQAVSLGIPCRVALAALVLCASVTGGFAVRQYANLLAALNSTGSGAMYTWLQPTKPSPLVQKLSDPNTQMTVLCFPPEAAVQCLTRYPWVVPQNLTDPAILFQYLQFYMIPNSSALAVSSAGPTTLPTLLQGLPTTDPAQTMANLTFAATDDPDMYWVGGLPPGGLVNVSDYAIAGKGRLYVVDSCITPPSTAVPPAYMKGFSMAEGLALADQGSVGHARSLLLADPELNAFISNPDNPMMLLAPVDTAIDQYLRSLNTNLQLFRGSAAARKLMQAHVFPGRPFTKADLAARDRALWSKDPATSVFFSSRGPDSVSIQGPNNTMPITILTADQLSGKSVMHIISDVIQPEALPTFPTLSDGVVSPPLSPTINPANLTAIALNLSIPVTVDVSGGAVLLDFAYRLRAALATWFGVPNFQVLLTRIQAPAAGTTPPSKRRALLATTTTLQYTVQVFADVSNPGTARQLAAQAAALQQQPGAALPADMVSRYGINTGSVAASVDTSSLQAQLASPSSPVPSAAPVAPSPSPGSSGGGGSNTKVIVGAVVGAVAGSVLLALGAVLLYLHCWRKPNKRTSRPYVPREKMDMQVNSLAERMSSVAGRPSDAHGVLVFSGLSGVPAPAKPATLLSGEGKASSRRHKPALTVQGLIFGDPFLRSTAPQYSWTDRVHDDSCVGVEAGINDQPLDKFGAKTGPPVIRLTRAEVVQQIRLLNTGLLGKGASALVFKGLWPSRFGPNALLAIKVLKDPYEADPTAYESFCYEAAVLASVRHPNVLRLYGYCLELPTACLIMELLPSSLKDTLYSRAPHGIGRQHSSMLGGHSRTRSGVNKLAQPSQPTPTIPLKSSPSMTAPKPEKQAPASEPERQQVANGSIAQLAKHPSARSGSGPGTAAQDASKPASGPVSNGVDVTLNPEQVSSAAAAAKAVDGATAAAVVRVPNRVDMTNMSAASHASVDTAASASSNATFVHNRLTILEVLQLSSDIAAGLAYLHKRPAVVALPAHPTLMLTPDPLAGSTDSDSGVHPDVENAKDEDGNMSIARIVHRDLKPSNILINSKGRAKISDFGLARWHSSSTVYTHHLGVGTLRYMAPELLLGHYTQPNAHTITNRVDIYSLGMLMWEMLSQQQPWHDLTDAQIVAAVMAGLRPPMSPVPLGLANGASSGSTSSGAASNVDSSSPATFETMPQLKALVGLCWNQKDSRRPTAANLQQELIMLLGHFCRDAQDHASHASP